MTRRARPGSAPPASDGAEPDRQAATDDPHTVLSAAPNDSADPDPAITAGRIQRIRNRAEAAASRYLRMAEQRPLLGIPLAFITRYYARQGMLMASAVAFRLFLWLLPLALLVAGLIAAISVDYSKALANLARSGGLAASASAQMVSVFQEGHKSWWTAVLIGGLAFLWTSRTLIRNLTVVNAHLWGIPAPKRSQVDVAKAALTFAGGWILIVAVTTSVGRLDLLPAGVALATVLEAVVVAAGWVLINIRLPSRMETWHDLLPGAAVFGVAFAALHLVARFYLPNKLARASDLYGALGIASAILVWLLVIGQVVVGAALLNSVLFDYKHRSDRGPGGTPMDITDAQGVDSGDPDRRP